MRGICGLGGWQWLFIVSCVFPFQVLLVLIDFKLEGAFTVLAGLVFIAFFPRDPGSPVSLLGVSYFSEREAHILAKRVLLDDPSKAHRGLNISPSELKAAVSHITPSSRSGQAPSVSKLS